MIFSSSVATAMTTVLAIPAGSGATLIDLDKRVITVVTDKFVCAHDEVFGVSVCVCGYMVVFRISWLRSGYLKVEED